MGVKQKIVIGEQARALNNITASEIWVNIFPLFDWFGLQTPK